ncbi:hypothetical protein GE21DRAFT_1289773 [Neurospora crassa]|nr:hypothetical protein GE21DRAFT_1289773 [Neurospora crassa]
MVLTVRTTGSIRVPGSPFESNPSLIESIDTISAHEPQDPSGVGGWAETLDPISFHDKDLLTIRHSPRSYYVVYISTRYGPEMEAVTTGLLSSKGCQSVKLPPVPEEVVAFCMSLLQSHF